MLVRRYEPKDFPAIQEWGEQWGATYQEHQFPKTGFIVENVAAVFLYKTDSSCCWLENMISNRNANKENKAEALNLLIQAVLTEAESLGFKVAYATTDNVPMVLKVKEYGAMVKPLQMLLIKILGPS
jgi:hypothetical protein